MKYIYKASILSLAAVAMLGMSGCSKDSEADDSTGSQVGTDISQTTTIGGSVVDGYLRYATVCLDLNSDSFCQPTEPFTLTDKFGAYTLNFTDAQKADGNYLKAQLVVYGGQDSDRPGEDFTGKLKAPNDGTGSANVTPVTTLISAYIERNGVSNITKEEIDAATAKVAAVLNLSVEQVMSDPRKTNDPAVINATLQLQYAVNAMSSAAASTDKKDVAGDIFAAFAAGLDGVSGTTDVASGIQAIIEKADSAKLNAIDPNLVKVKEVAKAAATNVNTVMGTAGADFSDAATLNAALTKVVVYQDKVVKQLAAADLNALDAATFDFSGVTIDFEEESAKIYLTDLGVDVEASDFNITSYKGKISFDKDLDELKLEFSGDAEILAVVTAKISEVETEAAKIEQDVSDAITSADADTKMAVLKDDVDALLATTEVADVADAKNLVTQLRESVYSFVDLEADKVEDNTSTILGSQVSLITSKIQPAVENIAGSFNASATALDNSVQAFSDSLETSFTSVLGSENIPGSIETRITAISDAIVDKNNTTNWSVTAGSDTLSHSYAKVDTTVTESFTFNGGTITASYEDSEDGKINSVTKTGTIEFKGTGYALNISALSFADNKASFKASGTIEGVNGAKMSLTALDISFDLDETKGTTLHLFNNIEGTFNGTIVSGGRTLTGKLVVSEGTSANNQIIGTYTGADGEPTFEGTITADISLDDIKSVTQDSRNKWIDPNTLLMVTYADGTKSFVDSYSHSANMYVLNTQNDRNLTCSTFGEYIYDENHYYITGYKNSVTCEGGSVKAYYGDNKVITLTVNGVEEQVDSTWIGWHWAEVWDYEADIDLRASHMYYDNGTLYIDYRDGSAPQVATVTDISIRDAKNMDEIDMDISFAGKLTHGTKIITAKAGLKHSGYAASSTVYAENIAIQDGTNFVKLAKLAAVSKSSYSYGGNMYSGTYYSSLENYTIKYNYYYEEDNSQEFSSVTADNLNISVTGIDGKTLTFDADVSYTQSSFNAQTVKFNGTYTYADTKFVGIVDVTGNDNTAAYTFGVSGDVEANGFEPFSVAIAGSFNNGLNAYGLFTRGTDYKLGVSLSSTYNETDYTSTDVFKLADSNGVMATTTDTGYDNTGSSNSIIVSGGVSEETRTCYVYDLDDNEHEIPCSDIDSEEAPFSLTLTDKDGKSLATFGEAATGNGWEIKYIDNTSETLF